MKLLFDQNLSHKLCDKLKDIYPDSNHIRVIGMHKEDDIVVWNFAKLHNYTIVSQDIDFFELSLIKGFPPKIIWIRTGNTTTENIVRLLAANQIIIKNFYKDNEKACLELS